MEFRELSSFALVAELGSIAAAARQTNLSPPTIHKYLKSLESELGARLYTRRNGALRLTPAGEFLLPHVRDLLTRHEGARAAIEDFKSARRGVVRFGAGPSFCCTLLPTLIRRFREEYPRVDLFVESGNGAHLMEGLRRGTLDVVFGLPVSASGELEVETAALWEAEAAFVSAMPGVGRRCPLPRLRDLPFVLFHQSSAMDLLIRQYLAELDVRPKVIMRSDSAEALKALVRAGIGVSVLFKWTVEADLASGALRALDPGCRPLRSRMALLRPRARFLNRPVRAFIEVAKSMRWEHLRLA